MRPLCQASKAQPLRPSHALSRAAPTLVMKAAALQREHLKAAAAAAAVRGASRPPSSHAREHARQGGGARVPHGTAPQAELREPRVGGQGLRELAHALHRGSACGRLVTPGQATKLA